MTDELTDEQRISLTVQTRLSREFIRAGAVKTRFFEDMMADEVIAQVRVSFAAERDLASDWVERVPRTWWQHLKMTLGLRWDGRDVPCRVYRVCTHVDKGPPA